MKNWSNDKRMGKMTTTNPGCSAAILRFFGLDKPSPKARLANPVSILGSALPDTPIKVQSIQPEKLPYRLRDDFLSPAEASFYQVLKSVVGSGLVICPRFPSPNSSLCPHRIFSGLSKQDRPQARRLPALRSQNAKTAFCHRTGRFQPRPPRPPGTRCLCGRSVRRCAAALLRIPARPAYNTNELIALFKAALQKKPAENPIEKQPVTAQAQPPLCPKCGVPWCCVSPKRATPPASSSTAAPTTRVAVQSSR